MDSKTVFFFYSFICIYIYIYIYLYIYIKTKPQMEKISRTKSVSFSIKHIVFMCEIM